ncbi:hypothetical protein SAMN02745857_02344 [Andreprevotia lacus DSM 23236]|jgi:hypothetical protein|uniref:Uncharacterized protein n=1 Tax=Andreprevotia lacus DSM 23236 TaxID=1121001 RepID=A0A1W1XPZ0_9NEIS|nr:DUF6717 family protein [Andreprevotia lacus]SMC25915.1 hypothetical protein SAMN02745857_02344 [Andreprevotia lacus DSM 23236]
MSVIHHIQPYLLQGLWVFDDATVGLVEEPFVEGTDTLIERAVAGIPDADNGFELYFADQPFAGSQLTLLWRREDETGNWYYCAELAQEGWLCPALFKYFDAAPLAIHVAVQPLNAGI